MPKKKIVEIVSKLKSPEVKKPAAANRPAIVAAPPDATHLDPLITEDLSQFPAVFENKAGRYELIRVDRGQAYYSFTNRNAKTVDATMSVITWRKMQERAATAYKETA